jgi:crotonobetainyl-CoA:carnitine CoA-transferase CaiB-like acyl-CoA transferase
MSGFMDLTRAGDVPVKSGISSADLIGAEMAVVAILGALEARDHSGLGQYIDLSMQDAGAWLTMPLWNGDESAPVPQVLSARDGFVVVEVESGDDALPGGIAPENARAMTCTALVAALSKDGYRAAQILSAGDMLNAQQTRARNLVLQATDAEGEAWPLLASPLRLKGTPPVVRQPMGALGSDGPAILAECPPALRRRSS